jgi:hypothetical protein
VSVLRSRKVWVLVWVLVVCAILLGGLFQYLASRGPARPPRAAIRALDEIRIGMDHRQAKRILQDAGFELTLISERGESISEHYDIPNWTAKLRLEHGRVVSTELFQPDMPPHTIEDDFWDFLRRLGLSPNCRIRARSSSLAPLFRKRLRKYGMRLEPSGFSLATD